MIAALILAAIGLGLMWSHPTEWWIGDAFALLVFLPLSAWLMYGGGERWLRRRQERQR